MRPSYCPQPDWASGEKPRNDAPPPPRPTQVLGLEEQGWWEELFQKDKCAGVRGQGLALMHTECR